MTDADLGKRSLVRLQAEHDVSGTEPQKHLGSVNLGGVNRTGEIREGDPEEEQQIQADAHLATCLQMDEERLKEEMELEELEQEMRSNFSLAGFEDFDSWMRWSTAYAKEACKGISVFQNVYQDVEAIKSLDFYKMPDNIGDWYKGEVAELFASELEQIQLISEDPPARFNPLGVRIYDTNPKGPHIIMRCQDILDIVKSNAFRRGDAYTEIYPFASEVMDPYFPYWRFIKAVPEFLNYITSDGFKQEYNDKVSDKSADNVQQPASKMSPFAQAIKNANPNSQVDRVLYKPLFGSEEWSYIWSIEGYGKATSTPKDENGLSRPDLKFLHAHMIIVRRGFKSSVNMRTAERIKNALISKFGQKVTVTYVNSRNQLKYIGKEKLIVGATLIVSNFQASLVCARRSKRV